MILPESPETSTEPVHVPIEIRVRTYHRALAVRKLFQTAGQILGPRHVSLSCDHRNNRNIAGEGVLNLQPYEIIRIIESALPLMVGDTYPVITDDCYKGIALHNSGFNHASEIASERYRVDVLEDRVGTKDGCETLVNAVGDVPGIVAAIR
jgi:hypothetical protein